MPKVLHIYTRVSTSAQEEDGTSLETQREVGIRRAEELGFEYKVWNEGGQSSNKDDLTNRPVLTELMFEIERDRVLNVFVYNTDRLSRNEQTWSFIRLRFVKFDVTLYTTTGVFNLTNPTDKMLLGIMSEVSAYDNAIRAERTRLGKLKRIKQGFWMGGPPPFGYAIQEKQLVENPEESKWVKFIFENYRDKVPVRDIKQSLLKNGVRTRRDNTVWSLGSIEAQLGNTHYAGFYVVRDGKTQETTRVMCPAILASTLYLEVQRERESRTRQTRVRESVMVNDYLLRDFLFCDHCGSRLSGRRYPKQYRSNYYCPRLERNFVNDLTEKVRKCENRRYLKIDETDALVWDTVVDVLSKSHRFKEEIKNQVLGVDSTHNDQLEKLTTLRRRIKRLDLEIRDLTASIVSLETDQILKRRSPDEVSKILVNVEGERLVLESEREGLVQQVYGIENQTKWIDWIHEFGDRIGKFADFTLAEKGKFLRGVIDKILVRTVDTQTHLLTLKFRVAYVDDALEWKNPKNKTKGYNVTGGESDLTVEVPASKKVKILVP